MVIITMTPLLDEQSGPQAIIICERERNHARPTNSQTEEDGFPPYRQARDRPISD